MKEKFIKSSPYFFRIIIRSAAAAAVSLMVLAIFIKAPLDRGADPSVTPNPLKSAWFLLWIQEIVSWSKLMIILPIALMAALAALPYISSKKMSYRAVWFPKELKFICAAAVIVFLAVIILTIIPYYYRGANWALTF